MTRRRRRRLLEPGPVGGQQQRLEGERRRPGQMASSSPVAPTSLAVLLGGDGRAGGQAPPASRSSSAWIRSGRPAVANTWLCGCSRSAGGTALVDDDQHRSEGLVAVGGEPPPPGRHHPRHVRHGQVGQGGLMVGVVDDHLVDPGRRHRPVETSVACGGGQRPANAGNLSGTTRTRQPGRSGSVPAAVGPDLGRGHVLVARAEGQPSGPRGCRRRPGTPPAWPPGPP